MRPALQKQRLQGPLREGKKWIATMWYREGVDAEKNWEYWNRINRSP